MIHPVKRLKSVLRNYYIERIIGNDLESLELNQCTIALYISGGLNNYYQFKQWEKPLWELHKRHKIVIAARNAKLFARLKKESPFPSVWLRTIDDLSRFYERYRFPVVFYLNNANKNFQSLKYTQGYHVHLNHGESEKESMYSNQSKAYDYVFCVGDRAVQRYKEALLNFDASKYIKIGRPQLDFIVPYTVEKKKDQKVILYAPTWEGHHASMDYSSLERYGIDLISELLSHPEYFVLYKPHSNVGRRRRDILRAHETILKMVSKSPNGKVVSDIDINSIFTAVDFAFFDNSSVMIDYLHADKPAFFFNIQEDPGLRYLAECFTPIGDEEFPSVTERLQEHLRVDPNKKQRKRIKTFYLGNYAPMGSTTRFIEKVSEIIERRGK